MLMKKCPDCGVAQENDAMFCDACGKLFLAPKRKLSVFCLACFYMHICGNAGSWLFSFLLVNLIRSV